MGETRTCGGRATSGHHKDFEVIVEASDVDGRPYIGDSVCADEDGPHHTIGCRKNTTTSDSGENTSFEESEDSSLKREVAKERTAREKGKKTRVATHRGEVD